MVKEISYDMIRPRFKKLFSACKSLGGKAISTSYFYSDRLQRSIDHFINVHDFDAIICYSSPTAEYLYRSKVDRKKIGKPLWLMDLIDVDSLKWKHYADSTSGIRSRIFKREAESLTNYEKIIGQNFDGIFLVSEAEKQVYKKISPSGKAIVLPNGVDLEYFNPSYNRKIDKDGPVIVFTGVMNYWPNVEGIEWFTKHVYPKVRKEHPNLTFYIVGSRPNQIVYQLGNVEGVVVTGFVEDVRPYLASADVCVVPLRIARGIQNKVLEAFAMEKAVVCTTCALGGIAATGNRDIMVANDADLFAKHILMLIEDEKERIRIAKNARNFVEEKFGWDRNLERLNQVICSTEKIMAEEIERSSK